jgi:DNA-binding NarL/FixJ family response regulator
MGAMTRTVLIVDDHDGFRAGARELLEAEGFEVLGEAIDADSALEAVRHLHPQVVVLDIQLPGLDGFGVAERIAVETDPPVVVLISSRAEHTYRRRLAASSARGFIPKSELTGDCLASFLH